jgi:hypothetical protein
MDDRYKYAEEKFSQARRRLMLPPQGKEALVISEACGECRLGLNNISLDDLDDRARDDRARDRISKLTELLERQQKSLSDTDKQELCDEINSLAYYFHDRWTGVWG